MGLDSIWDKNGNYLTKKSKDFYARSTGCSCCAIDLSTEKDVRKEAIDSLSYIYRAVRFFKWDFIELMEEAKKEVSIKDKEAKE